MERSSDDLAWLAENHARLCEIRRDFHRHPEIAFEETWTAGRLAAQLRDIGCDISGPFGTTGFVATLKGGDAPAVALRCDMDALPQHEDALRDYGSQIAGRMHACGHDGHMTILIAVASLLARGAPLAGPVHFICQPAEEVGKGAPAMLADGLFDAIRPVRIYGYHNWPELPLGVVSAKSGPIMAAYVKVAFEIGGRGGHAALPHLSDDMYGAMAALITHMSAAVRRDIRGAPSAFAFTQNTGGSAANIIPHALAVSASFRYSDPAHLAQITALAEVQARAIEAAFGVRVCAQIEPVFDATVNDAAATAHFAAQVERLASRSALLWQEAAAPSMVAEDFGAMLAQVPGCYFWLGAGMEQGALHNSRFDFNDDLLRQAPHLIAELLRQAQ